MHASAEGLKAPADFLSGGGQMAELIRRFDWSVTYMGAIDRWPTAVRTTVGLILNSPVPMATLWGDCGIMIYNDAYAGLAGTRHPALLGMPVREAWPELAEFSDNAMRVVLAGGVLSYRGHELTLHRSDRPEQVFMNIDYSPVLGESGRPIGVIAIVVETTGYVRVHERLVRSEERFRALTTSTSSITYRMNADWSELLELEGQGVLADVTLPARNWVDAFVLEEDRPALRAEIDAAVRSRRPLHNVHRAVQVDGGIAWLESRAVPLMDAEGRVVEWFGAATDITESQLTSERRAARQQRQLRLFEQAPGFIIIMRGPDHLVEFVNNAHRRVFNSGDWIGLPLREVFPTIEGQGFSEALAEVYSTGRTREFNAVPVRFPTAPDAGAVVRYLTFVYAPLYEEDGGEIEGIFCEGHDVTEAYMAQRRTAALAELGDCIRELSDPDELAYAASEILGRELNVSRVGYGTIDKRAETISIEHEWTAAGVESLAGVLHFRDYGSHIDDLKRGETVVVENAHVDPRTRRYADNLSRIGAKSFINLPMTEQGGFVALLYLTHAEPRSWSEDERAFIRDIAERMRTAVERRRAEAELRQNEERLRFLDQLSKQTANSSDADDILSITTGMLGSYLSVSICAYADVDPDQEHFTIRGDWSAPGSSSIRGYYSLGAFGQLAVTSLMAGEPLIINDNLKELAPEQAEVFRSLGIGSTMCMPLVKEGRLIALMAVNDKGPHQWCERELALLSEVTERSWAHIERVRSEAAARENDAQFRTLAQVMPSHVWTARPDGLLDWFNDQVYAYSGVKPGEIDGYGWVSIIHPDDVPSSVLAWQAALEAGSDYQMEFRVRRADGEWRWHLSRAVALRDEYGNVHRWVGTNTDVHDQKNAEALLEARLAERTTALAETSERLQQSQKMEAIGNLTGGVAHDFNNLLSAVLGSLELLRKRIGDDPALLRLVDNAVEGANRGASLTRRMLAFARRQDLQSDRIDVGELVAGMRELLERSLGPMISIAIDLPPDLPPIETDANQLESALLNLAVNARDAMNGEGRITIAGRRETLPAGRHGLSPGPYLCLSLTDTGEGMDETTLRRAAEPFYTTKGVGKGTGLGLSMVHGLATQSGGTLVLKSRKGEGLTAEIWLPATNGDVDAVPAPAAAPPSEDIAGTRPLRILAVDDDALVLMNTTAMLEDLGHAVREAFSGREALAQLLADPHVDLVITDHAMPQMTGAQLASEIRNRWPDLPILLATGYAELPSGADPGLPRLSKPFSQVDLRRALAACAPIGRETS